MAYNRAVHVNEDLESQLPAEGILFKVCPDKTISREYNRKSLREE